MTCRGLTKEFHVGGVVPGKFPSLADRIVLADCSDAYDHWLLTFDFGLRRPPAPLSYRATCIPPDSSVRSSASTTLQVLAIVARDPVSPELEAEGAAVITTR